MNKAEWLTRFTVIRAYRSGLIDRQEFIRRWRVLQRLYEEGEN